MNTSQGLLPWFINETTKKMTGNSNNKKHHSEIQSKAC